MKRYVKVFIRGQYDKNDIVTFHFDLEDIHDKQLYKMFKEQNRIDKEESFIPHKNTI